MAIGRRRQVRTNQGLTGALASLSEKEYVQNMFLNVTIEFNQAAFTHNVT
ncbi:MAG: hypothetical protein LBQ93_11720 [Treponema sp.]|nr:hypothetical protein [Treponema sp.]